MYFSRMLVVGVVAACVAAAVPHAAAINIIPVFNAADNETPPFDLFNGGIQDLFDYSEGYYEDMLEGGSYTLTVNYWYEDLSGSFIGFFNPVTTVGNRVIEANVRIDTRVGDGGDYRNWYIDSTPASDGEFEMEKTLWSDADFSVKSAFIASPDTPDAFEVGYRGSAVGGSQAEGKYDMLSTILHEIGHALGIRGGATHENSDDDYDINPDFLFGEQVAVEIDVDDGEPDPGHVLPGTMLMCGRCGAANVRRRPSHADLFAIATSAGITNIDVPRREFYGGGVFNFAPNWSGGRTPDPNDDAFVRDAGLVVMNANDSIASLTILQSQLATGSNSLEVNGLLHVASRFSNVKGKVVIGTDGTASADDVEIARNGEVDLVDSTLAVGDDLDLLPRELPGESDGLLSGSGTVNVGGTLRNRGTIKPEGGVLTINAGSFDLDGPSGGFGVRHIDVTTGNVVFAGPHLDSFDSQIDVGFARLATFKDAWTLGESGELTITDGGLINNAPWQADGVVQINHPTPIGVVGVGGTGSMTLGPTGQITTNGVVDILSPAEIHGSLIVETDTARFSGSGTFADSADVALAAGSELQLIQQQTYTVESNVAFSGPGTIRNGDLATLVFESNADVGAPVVNQGRVEIGTSSGVLNMSADFEQTETGTIEFEIGGTTPGRQYDVLDATGFAVTLSGTLELAVTNGYMPTPGQVFTIITADSIIEEFSTVVDADIGNGSFFDVIYDPDAVLLEVISGLAGDYNNNGTVDAADYIVWRDQLGQQATLPNEQATFGMVTQEDYDTWRDNFGNTLGSAASSNTAVPEPWTEFTLLIAMATLLSSSRTLVAHLMRQ